MIEAMGRLAQGRGIPADAVKIVGTGSYVPARVLANHELVNSGFGTTDEWIVQRTGINERRIARSDEVTSDLGYETAARFNRVDVSAIDWFVPHQANLRMFQFISRRMEIPMEKFYLTLDKYGNISSASCAIALDEAIRDGSTREGNLVRLPVFGGGLTWGSEMLRW